MRACRGINSRFAGTMVGTINSAGYLVCSVAGRLYLVHRIIWKLMTGDDVPIVDHMNGQRCENWFANLRACTISENNRNSFVRLTSKSGSKGVFFAQNRWVAQIRVDGKQRQIGRFKSREEAERAYATAASTDHGQFAKHETATLVARLAAARSQSPAR